MAAGGALFFTMPSNPTNLIIAIISALAVTAIALRPKSILVRAICVVIFGFVWSQIYTAIINTPQLTRTLRDGEIIGTVTNIDFADNKTRVFLRVKSDDIGALGRETARIRVSMRDMPVPNIGDTIQATVNLYSPSLPSAPGAFDYARWAYFNNLTATGYVTEYSVIDTTGVGMMRRLRLGLHNSADSFLVDSLVLGYKSAVPKSDNQIWTATGVGHVWSISGFHVTLVSGWLFVIFMFLFRRTAPIVRRVPARFPALICAGVGLLFYLILSGTDVATVRAFLMTMLVFIAVLMGRTAISMRSICIAFCIIFLINPHYVMQAGFQLSFSAVFGLIWLWSDIKPKMPANKILKIIYGATLTSIVAMIFTAPFVIAHFGALPIYSLIGNLILLPIFSFAIMPLVILGTFTAMFGITGPLKLAEQIYDITFVIANKIATLPGANMTMPNMPNAALVIFIIGFLCLMFIKPVRVKINYILFGALSLIGIAVVIMAPRPIFFATHDNELIGVVMTDGKLRFNKSRAANHYFAFDTWKQINGEAIDTPNQRLKHDHGVYRINTENFNLVYIQKFVPLQKNIAQLCNDNTVDYIVSYFKINSDKCAHKILRGGHVIYKSGRIQFIHLRRPWHNLRG